MPSKCCIPKCKSNYDSSKEKFSVFKFPNDEDLKKQWLNAIPRENFTPSKSSRVCQLHFQESDIERETFVYHSLTGEKLSATLKVPRLKKNAVPSQFPGHPSYLPVKEIKIESSEEIQMNNINEQLNGATVNTSVTIKKEDKSTYFESFDELLNLTEGFQVSPFWHIVKKEESLIFAHFDFEDVPTIVSSVVIDKQLILKAYFLTVPLVKCGNDKIPKKVSSLDEILSVLDFVENF